MMSDFAGKQNSTSDLRFPKRNVWRGCAIVRLTREELSFLIEVNL